MSLDILLCVKFDSMSRVDRYVSSQLLRLRLKSVTMSMGVPGEPSGGLSWEGPLCRDTILLGDFGAVICSYLHSSHL